MSTSWNLEMERVLLDLVIEARQSSGGKSLKKKSWKVIEDRMSERYNVELTGKCQPKYTRIMTQFKLYKFISNLSGAGVEEPSGRVLLEESVWAGLLEAADKNTQCTYRAFQRGGFPHRNACGILSGDAQATGASGSSLLAFVSREDDASDTQSPETDATNAESSTPTSSSRTATPSKNDDTVVRPASHTQRDEAVKRLRDGRKKATSANAAAASAEEHALEAFIAACKASEQYFSKKQRLLGDEE